MYFTTALSRRQAFPEESILLLEKWFQTVSNNPNQRLTKTFVNDLKDLALESKLSVKQIYRWIQYKQRVSTTKRKQSDISQRKILRDYFKINTHPNKDELESLSTITKCSKKRLASWFAKERFKFKVANRNIIKS